MADPQDRKGEAGRAVASFNQRRGMCRKEEEEAKEGRKKNRDDDIEKGAKTTARLAGGWRTRKWVISFKIVYDTVIKRELASQG